MKYYETAAGLFATQELPRDMRGVTELTSEEYEKRIAQIRAEAEARPPEPEEPIDPCEEELSSEEALEIITGGGGT